jgi:hypothetical protein
LDFLLLEQRFAAATVADKTDTARSLEHAVVALDGWVMIAPR